MSTIISRTKENVFTFPFGHATRIYKSMNTKDSQCQPQVLNLQLGNNSNHQRQVPSNEGKSYREGSQFFLS